jgi:hypothetical protein
MPTRRDPLPFFYRLKSGGQPVSTRVDRRTLAFFAIMLTLIGLAGWLYLRQSSEVAAYAHDIRMLEQNKERLHREITALRAEVAMLGALKRVDDVGSQLGYHLPAAANATQHMRIAYQPPEQPSNSTTSAISATMSAPGTSALEDSKLRATNLVQRLITQLRVWIEAPLGDSGS